MIEVPPGVAGPPRRRVRLAAPPAPATSTEPTPSANACASLSIGARGAFLLAMAFVTFEAFALCVLLELARLFPSAAQTWLPRHAAASLLDADETLVSACMYVLLLAVPVTSVVAPSSATSKPAKPSRKTPQRDPLFRVFQLVAWALYAAFLGGWASCPRARWSLCALEFRSTMATLAFLAESLVVSSVLALERHRAPPSRFAVVANNLNNMLLVVGALLLAVGAEAARHSDEETREHARALGQHSLSAGVNSAVLVVAAVFNTYGLSGGHLAPKRGWKFFQPFAGGARFMLCQAVSWTCFAVGLFLQGLYVLSVVIVELELFVGAMALAGSLFVVAEVVMVVSLLVFKADSDRTLDTDTLSISSDPSNWQQRLRAFTDDCLGAVFVGVMANTQWIPSALFSVLFALTTRLRALEIVVYTLFATLLSFVFVASRAVAVHWYNQDSAYGARTDISEFRVKYLAPQLAAMALPLVATHAHYAHGHEAALPLALLSAAFYVYVATYRGQPQVTGARTRATWQRGHSAVMETVVRYFQGKILRDAPLDPEQNYILGFHPHGIMSTSVLWLQFSQQWRALFPGVHAAILTASVLHQIPLARDVLQFFGGREVTRQAFTRALESKESVLLVPGGQAEMLEQRSGQKQVRVYTKHLGFLRLALEHGTPLVPVLSFKEGETMDNIQAPAMQRWFVKRLAFPLPFLPYGRFGLPVPRSTPICIAVGAPIHVPHAPQPTKEDVERVHAEYFGRLRALFDKYKDEAGCRDYSLVLV